MKFDLHIEDIKYIKILYASSEGSPVTIKAALKKISEREITACIKCDENTNIPEPQEITLSLVCPDGLYRTKTRLKSCTLEQPFLFFYLDIPQNLEFKQNREFFRVPVSYKCKYFVKNDEKTTEYDADVFDISANGISINMPVHAFSEEDAEIRIETEKRIIPVKVRYIRSEKTDSGYKISFAYTEIKANDRDYISQICILKQLESKRNNAV